MDNFDWERFWPDFYMAFFWLFLFLAFIGMTNNEPEPVKDKRQQIVTIKNNGQEIEYTVDGDKVKLSYQGE